MDNFYSRCLLCTCRPDVTPHLHIFSKAGKQLQLADKINKYLNIQIEAELPQNVCFSCMGKLAMTSELMTSSQQARIMLLQIKQENQEIDQGISENSTLDLNPYQAVSRSATISHENAMDIETNLNTPAHEIHMDNSNCSAQDFDHSGSALHFNTQRSREQGETFGTVFSSEIVIKQESGENQLDCLQQNAQSSAVLEPPLDNNTPGCSVLMPESIKCNSCSFQTNSKQELATHVQTHKKPNNSNSHGSRASRKKSKKEPAKCNKCDLTLLDREWLSYHKDTCHSPHFTVKPIRIKHEHYNFQCIQCGAVLPSTLEIMRHLLEKHKYRFLPFTCKVCSQRFSSRHYLNLHRKNCKTSNPATINIHDFY